jgi:hypothetical protein
MEQLLLNSFIFRLGCSNFQSDAPLTFIASFCPIEVLCYVLVKDCLSKEAKRLIDAFDLKIVAVSILCFCGREPQECSLHHAGPSSVLVWFVQATHTGDGRLS